MVSLHCQQQPQHQRKYGARSLGPMGFQFRIDQNRRTLFIRICLIKIVSRLPGASKSIDSAWASNSRHHGRVHRRSHDQSSDRAQVAAARLHPATASRQFCIAIVLTKAIARAAAGVSVVRRYLSANSRARTGCASRTTCL